MRPEQWHRRSRLDGVYLVLVTGRYQGVWGIKWKPLEWQNAYRQWCLPYNGPALLAENVREIGERVSLPILRRKAA